MVRSVRFHRAFVVLAFVVACGGSGDDGGAPAPGPSPIDAGCTDCSLACPSGFAAADDGCVPVLAAGSCTAGTRLAIGESACVPVGVSTCAAGFDRDASGWGCTAVVPAAACKGATRERLGSRECVPVGDCTAAFPPAGATHVVDPAGALDATHFHTIAEAIAAAPEGAVIAVAAGTYAETIAPTKKVTVTGVCAEKTILVGSGGDQAGIFLNGVKDVVVKNLTVRGFAGGAAVYDATATFDAIVIDENTVAGAVVSNAGSKLRLVGSVVRGTKAAGLEGTLYGVGAQRGAVLEIVDSAIVHNEMINVGVFQASAKLSVERSVVRDGYARTSGKNAGLLGVGVYASDSGEATITESALLDHVADAIDFTKAGSTPSKGTVTRSTIRGVARGGNDTARGLEVSSGASATIEETTISGCDEYEIIVTQQSSLEGKNVTTRREGERAGIALVANEKSQVKLASAAFFSPSGTAVQAQVGSEIALDGALIRDVVPDAMTGPTAGPLGFGAVARSRSTITLGKTWIDRASTVGVLMGGISKVTLDEAIVSNTQPYTGPRLAGRGVSVEEGSTFTMTRSALLANAESGLATTEETKVAVTDSLIDATHFDADGRFGVGALVTNDTVATFQGVTIRGSQGIGLAVAGATVAFRGGSLAKNAVAVHAQEGSTVVEGSADDAPAQYSVDVSAETRFVGNATRVGSGVVPLPDGTFGDAQK